MDVIDAIHSRRSIRSYQSNPGLIEDTPEKHPQADAAFGSETVPSPAISWQTLLWTLAQAIDRIVGTGPLADHQAIGPSHCH